MRYTDFVGKKIFVQHINICAVHISIYQNIVVIITYDLICLLIYPFQNVPKLVKLHGFPDPASCIFFGKCQYYDKKLQYFRGCIGYATICQKFVENLFKHTWQGCSLWHFCTHVNACS